MDAIEISGLTKEYRVGFLQARRKRALSSLTLHVNQGEVFGLLGPNGAGKTTTLKILFRLIFPTAGTARIMGRGLDDVKMHQKVGYLPENPYFYDHLSAEELLYYSGRLFGMGGDDLRRRIENLIEKVGLGANRKLALRRLSKGLVQRTGIAQALINNPDVIFLDEPMSGLDPVGRREVRDLILQLRAEGKTVFFSTHILSDAEVLCDRVAILNGGNLLGMGELHQILALGTSLTELTLENPPADALEKIKPLVHSAVRTGDLVRIEIHDETSVDEVLSACLRAQLKVVSLNPVKMSLEDYFLSKISPPQSTLGGQPS